MSNAPAVKKPAALKIVPLHEAEAHKSSFVYVVNKTNPKGNISIVVPDGMGNQVSVRIPITWIPIDLTTQATKKSLLATPAFRSLVARKYIDLINPDSALEYLEDPEAAKEMARIFKQANVESIGAPTENNNALSAELELEEGNINPIAMNIALAKDLEEDDALRLLRTNESSLVKADFQYIAENSTKQKVKDYAAGLAL